MKKITQGAAIVVLVMVNWSVVWAQDKRAQYPGALQDSYIGVNIGYIHYPFSQSQLEPGFVAESVHIPHTALRVILFGHRFNKYLSAQISYMRPVGFVEYRNINGTDESREVGMNIGGLSLRSSLPVSKKIVVNAEAGLAIVTRGGFIVDNEVALRDATYASVLIGGGVGYHLNKNWEMNLNAVWSPANKQYDQPVTVFYSAGFNYTMRKLSREKVETNSNSGYIFPKQVLQIGFATNAMGYGVNDLFSKTVPIFWGGNAEIEQGVCIQYQRNIFHGRKVFSLDWGATMGWWQSNNKERFLTLALFPLLRFTAFHFRSADLYFNYSLAGPAFISRTRIDGVETGQKFTFQDFMGMGIFAGKKRELNAEIRIGHYSNGNIFPKNDGVKVPLTFNIGYAFD